MVAVAVSLITATTARLTFSSKAVGTTSIEVQLADNPDFQFTVAPIFNVGNPASTYDLAGLNQRQTYYGRAREITGAGEQPWSTIFAWRSSDGTAQVTTPASVMIEPAMLVVPNPVLSWDAANVVAGFPVANLGRLGPVGWKGVSATPTITVGMGGDPWDTVALLNTNLPEAATVTIRGGASAAAAAAASPIVTAVPFRASQNLPGRQGYHGLFRLGSVVAHQFAHITIGGTLPSANTVYAEHCVIGLNRTSKNYSVDKKETPLDMGSLERTRSGVPAFLRGFRMRRVEFDISMLTEAQYETLYADLGRRVGLTEPVLVVPNTKANAFLHDRILYGNLGARSIANPASPRFTASFAVDSVLA